MKIDLLELVKAELLLAIYLAPFLGAVYYILKKWGVNTLKKNQEKEYEFQYNWISAILELGGPTLTSQEHLEKEFKKLESMPYKNPKKTKVLHNRILYKSLGYKKTNTENPCNVLEKQDYSFETGV